MNKQNLKSVLAAVLCAAVLTVPAGAAELTFRDVPAGAWYYNDVLTAVEDGLVNGRSADAFCPEDSITAAEAVKLAACIRQKKTTDAVTLKNGDPWYATYAAFAKENGILGEDPDWNSPISRADCMVLFSRALPEEENEAINDIPDGAFPDLAAQSPKAEEIYRLARAGIVQGDEKHLVHPDDPVRRCEVAALLTRVMNAESRLSFNLSTENPVRASDFTGMWQDRTSGRASLTVMSSEEYPFYDVKIVWGDSASSAGEWTMKASFSEAAGRMTYENGEMAFVTYDAEGKETRDVHWSDGQGYFSLEADGTMRWQDSRETRSAEFRLERVPTPVPSPDQLTEEFFRVVGGIESGTAGASLKQALAIRDVLQFAVRNDLWAVDAGTLRDNLLTAWLAMTDEERGAFDANFISLLTRMRDAWEDWDAARGAFDDAGAAEAMDPLMDLRSARLSWDILTSNTLTMGNSAGD